AEAAEHGCWTHPHYDYEILRYAQNDRRCCAQNDNRLSPPLLAVEPHARPSRGKLRSIALHRVRALIPPGRVLLRRLPRGRLHGDRLDARLAGHRRWAEAGLGGRHALRVAARL